MSKKYDSQKQEGYDQAPPAEKPEPPEPEPPAEEPTPPEPSPDEPKQEGANSDFVGTWICQYYDWPENQILPPPKFPLTITQEGPDTLDGSYPLPGHDAKMWGYLSHDGRLWAGTFKGLLEGTFVFILDDSKQSFHGAWVLDEAEGPPQPWWGVRQP